MKEKIKDDIINMLTRMNEQNLCYDMHMIYIRNTVPEICNGDKLYCKGDNKDLCKDCSNNVLNKNKNKNEKISKDEFIKYLETFGLSLCEYQIEFLYNMYIYEYYNTNIHVSKYKK